MSTRRAFAEPFGHAEARLRVRGGVDDPWRAFGVVDQHGRILRGEVTELDGDDRRRERGFHTYAIDWSPEQIVWSVDGRPRLRLVPDERAASLALVLNLAVEGRQPGRMTVDFVRVAAGEAPLTPPSEPPSASPSPSESPSPSPSASPSPTTPPPSATPPPTSAAPAPAWKAFTQYAAGDVIRFKGADYKVLENHTALPGWEPTALPNLFEKV